jgi:hypothetical protein
MAIKTKLTKSEIETLNGLKPEERTTLLSLLTEAEEASDEVEKLRKKQPADSQLVVEKTDYAAMKNAIAERDQKLTALEQKLASINLEIDGDDFLSMFSPVSSLFGTKAK